ncbi:MAG: twin-arginine translocase TatA/TatE family subunit [Candidatus Oxydemutatoraceae bacterium WSBS_2016_MAG_OTU14]
MSWGPLQIIVILAVVLLLFGSKKIRNLGSDLGAAIKGFKKSVSDDSTQAPSITEEKKSKDDTE